MTLMKKTTLAAMIFALGCSIAQARPATEAEDKALAQTAQDIASLMDKGEMLKAITQSIPPKALTKFAAMTGKSEDEFMQMMNQQVSAMAQQVKISETKYDLSQKKAGEFDNGDPYYIIPISQTGEASGKKFKVDTQAVAILENGTWYLIGNQGGGQKAALEETYPGFAKINLAAPVTTPIE